MSNHSNPNSSLRFPRLSPSPSPSPSSNSSRTRAINYSSPSPAPSSYPSYPTQSPTSSPYPSYSSTSSNNHSRSKRYGAGPLADEEQLSVNYPSPSPPPPSFTPTNTAASTHQHANPTATHHTNTSNSTSNSHPSLESEYIVNLQQQIYFLELELNLIKKEKDNNSALPSYPSASTSSHGGGRRGAVMDDDENTSDPISDISAPIEKSLSVLRDKILQLELSSKDKEENHQNSLSEWKKKYEISQWEITKSQAEYSDLKVLYETLKGDYLSLKNEYYADKNKYHESITTMKEKLEDNENIMRRMRGEYSEEKVVNRIMGEKMDLNTKEISLSYKETMEELQRTKSQLYEKEEELKILINRIKGVSVANNNPNNNNNNNNSLLHDDLTPHLPLYYKWSVLDTENSHLRTQLSDSENKVKSLLSEHQILKFTVEEERGRVSQMMKNEGELIRKVKEMEREREEVKWGGKWWAKEMVEMERIIKDLRGGKEHHRSSLSSFPSSISSLEDKEEISRLRTENVKLSAYLNENKLIIEELNTKMRGLEDKISFFTNENAEIKAKITILLEESSHLSAENTKLKDEKEKIWHKYITLQMEWREIKEKFRVDNAMKGVKLGEFLQMAQSSKKMSEMIEGMMGKLQEENGSGKSDGIKGREGGEREEKNMNMHMYNK